MTKLTMGFAAGLPLFLLCSLAYSAPSLETQSYHGSPEHGRANKG